MLKRITDETHMNMCVYNQYKINKIKLVKSID